MAKQWSDKIYRNRRHCKQLGLIRISFNWHLLVKGQAICEWIDPNAQVVSTIPPRWQNAAEQQLGAAEAAGTQHAADESAAKQQMGA